MPEVLRLPRTPVPADEIPEPWNGLLVHLNDMTSTLSEHHGQEILLEVLERMEGPASVTRTVLLMAGDQPVEYGWITIQLDPFPQEARELIREGRHPLGWILERTGAIYQCDPHTYFMIEADAALQARLQTERDTLYGRVNRITTPDGDLIADVVEILP